MKTPDSTDRGPKPDIGVTALAAAAERITAAAEALDAAMARVIQHIEAQQSELGSKVDRIVAAIDESGAACREQLEARVADLERVNSELKARASQLAERAARKTLPPTMTMLLAKNGVEAHDRFDAAALEKSLAALSVEQRIAVKTEMARAGLID
ncbi:MAG TPA: hypothetical protein VFA60_00665 [Terriglobales bacterium]|nr:hypothetical protein [Terriglobales bacterium]